jgi:hypothetical protein
MISGQNDGDFCPGICFRTGSLHRAFHLNLTIVFLNNRVNNCQAESGSLSGFLCGKEWLEHLADIAGRNAMALVDNFNYDMVGVSPGCDENVVVGFGCILGIVKQIYKNLA